VAISLSRHLPLITISSSTSTSDLGPCQELKSSLLFLIVGSAAAVVDDADVSDPDASHSNGNSEPWPSGGRPYTPLEPYPFQTQKLKAWGTREDVETSDSGTRVQESEEEPLDLTLDVAKGDAAGGGSESVAASYPPRRLAFNTSPALPLDLRVSSQ